MPLVHVASLDDPRLDPYRHLKATNVTRGTGMFIAEGAKLVERLIESEHELVSVLASEAFVERNAPQIPPHVPVFVVPRRDLEQLIGFKFHRGVLACGRRRPGPGLAEFLRVPRPQLTLAVCPDVRDPENLGVIIRISRAFGVDALLLGPECADPFSRRVLRVSMGTVFRLPVFVSDEFTHDLQLLRAARVQLAATVLDPGAERLQEARRPCLFALLFGSEGHGLERRWLELCDRKITIPMAGGTDSLNVAVAAGIFLYHFTRPAALQPDR